MPVIYQTSHLGDADLPVALVDRSSADLLVHRVSSRGMARAQAHWYITRDRQEADLAVCFVSPGMARLTICFVDNHSEAGWQKRSPVKLPGSQA